MEDRDGKRPFVIPKTHTSNKDTIISEKPDSRNVTELFDDIKTYALDAHFNFRSNECKSCDTIRNQKLQKQYNERRVQMKKDQDPIERLAFHIVTYRDIASNIANDGLHCEQLSFPIEQYLGNPKDGVHLSRRPDVLLTSSGAQGLYRFGLLVCKILLGKGYATVPSVNNNQFSAQLHYDHHFCKMQSVNKEQRNIDELLAKSLIYCYEHDDNMEITSRPSQILPIAVVWYDLATKFAFESIFVNNGKIIANHDSQNRKANSNKKTVLMKKKPSNSSTNPAPSDDIKPLMSLVICSPMDLSDSTKEKRTESLTTTDSSTCVGTKYPTHFLIPYNRMYSSPSALKPSNIEQPQQQTVQPNTPNTSSQITQSRDPRLLRTKRDATLGAAETIPLSPQSQLSERFLTRSSSDDPLIITKGSSTVYIPLNPSAILTDPRLKTLKSTRNMYYLELQAFKHALQQQRRLNYYYDAKNGVTPKTTYSPVPFLVREVSSDEYERLLSNNKNACKFHKQSNNPEYPSLYVSVVDCFDFGLIKATDGNKSYIDLEQNENQLAYDLIEKSNELTQRERQLNSQHIRLRVREKRQRKMHQQINDKKTSKSLNSSMSTSLSSLPNSKVYITTGRKLLKEHKMSTKSSSMDMPLDFLDFFSREYKNENRPYVKHLLAELVGIFIEKYNIPHDQATMKSDQIVEDIQNLTKEPVADDQTLRVVIDMDIDSPSSQGLYDHDERFRIPTHQLPPPISSAVPLLAFPPLNDQLFTPTLTSLFLGQTSLTNTISVCESQSAIEQYQKNEPIRTEQNLEKKPESNLSTEELLIMANIEQLESSSRDDSPTDGSHAMTQNNDISSVKQHRQPQHEMIRLPACQDTSIDVKNDPTQSRDELVRLLTNAYISRSPSPVKSSNDHRHQYDYQYHRQHQRQPEDNHDDNDSDNDNDDEDDLRKAASSLSSSHQRSHRLHSRSSFSNNRHAKASHNSISSTRTVTIASHENQNIQISTDDENEPVIKRSKIDRNTALTDAVHEYKNVIDKNRNDQGLKSIVTIPANINDQDQRRDSRERRQISKLMEMIPSISDQLTSKASRSRSKSQSKDSHERQRRLPETYVETSLKVNAQSASKPKHELRKSPNPTNNYQHRYHRLQLRTIDEYRNERRKHSDLLNREQRTPCPKQEFDRHDSVHKTSLRESASGAHHRRTLIDATSSDNLCSAQKRQSLGHRKFNYNHQSVADHQRFTHSGKTSLTPLMDLHYPRSSTHRSNASSTTMDDRNFDSLRYKTHLYRSNGSNGRN